LSERTKELTTYLFIALFITILNLPLLLGPLNAKDAITFSYPYFTILKNGLKNGEFPLWSHLLNYPAFAESQGGFAHPLHIILSYLLPPWLAHNITILVHLLLAGLSLYAFIRLIGLSRISSVIGGLAFASSSQFSLHLGIMPFIEGASYTPLLLFLAEKAKRGNEIIWYGLFILVGGLSLLCGHFQFASMGIALSLLYILFTSNRKFLRRLIITFILISGIFVVSSIQLLPSLELALHSDRLKSGFNRLEQSYNPIHLITFFDNSLFGSSPHPPAYNTTGNIALRNVKETYWGSGSYFESTYSIGLIPFLFAMLAVFAIHHKRLNRIKWFFVLMTLIGIFLALGKFNPLAKLILKIPPLSFFRMPARYMFLTLVSLSVLSAMGVDALNREKIKKSFINLLVITQIAFIITIIILNLLITEEGNRITNYLTMRYGERDGSADQLSTDAYQEKITIMLERAGECLNITNSGRLRTIVMVAMFIGVSTIAIRSRKKRTIMPLLLVSIITLIDIAQSSVFRERVIPYTQFKSPECITSLKSAENYSIFSSGWDLADERFSTELLVPNTNILFGLRTPIPRLSFEHQYTALMRRLVWTNLHERGRGTYPLSRYTPTTKPVSLKPLEMLSIKYLLTTHQIISEEVKLISKIDRESFTIYLYELINSPPLIYTPSRFIYVKDIDEMEEYITDNNFIPEYDLIITGSRSLAEYTDGGEVIIDAIKDNQIEMTYIGEGGYIATSILSYPGWRCFIDGVEVGVEEAFGGLMAIPIQPGEHLIVLEFLPATFATGLYISLTGTIIIILIICNAVLRMRREP